MKTVAWILSGGLIGSGLAGLNGNIWIVPIIVGIFLGCAVIAHGLLNFED